MKKLITSLTAALFAALLPSAQAETPSLTGSLTTKYNTGYIGKNGVVFYRHPTIVNFIDLNVGEDWTVEAWSSIGLGKDKFNTTFGDEFDLFVTWHPQLFDDVKFSLTAGYFFIKDLGDLESDIWILESEVSYAKYSYLQPYLCVRYFGEISDRSPERGWFGWAGVRGSVQTFIPRTRLSYDLSGAYSDGAGRRTPGAVFCRAVIGLPVEINKRVTFTPSVLFQTPIGDQWHNANRYTHRNEVVGSLAVKVSF